MKTYAPDPTLDPTLDAELSVIDLEAYRRRRIAALCLHNRVVLDPNDRSVSCEHCKAILDPFDTLVKLTGDWDRVRELAALRRRLLVHIEELNRVAANARAAAKRAGAADLPDRPR